MASTIKIKNSSTTEAVPTASDLVQGELAVNVTDTGLYTENASGTVVKLNAPSIDDKNTGATKYVTIASGGNVGIGTSSPSATFGSTLLQLNGATSSEMRYTSGNSGVTGADGLSVGIDSSNTAYFYNRENAPIVFGTNNSDRVRIDSSGNLLVAKSASSFSTVGIENKANGELWVTTDGAIAQSLNRLTSNGEIVRFHRSGTNVGNINVTTTATAYVTSSDYRLKENIAPMTGALDTVAQLKPCTYSWKSTGEAAQGFIAHELQEVVPECVVGEKDAVDANGNPVYQGIDTSFLVATLTAAIQELAAASVEQQAMIAEQSTLITTLTERITALEQA